MPFACCKSIFENHCGHVNYQYIWRSGSFAVAGFVGAMISNIAFVFRNIFSKRGMVKSNKVGGMNYYACLSILSLVFLTPFAFAVEGPKLWATGWQQASETVGQQFVW
jgi:solute carrier family 35 protein E1